MAMYDPDLWKYRAEGNKHIVVSNESGQVLRLKKRNQLSERKGWTDDSSDTTGKDHAVDVLKFQEHIALPLMRNCSACHVAKKVILPATFMELLSTKIQEQRPDFRKHKDLESTGYGLLMQDCCFLSKSLLRDKVLSSNITLCPDTYSVEIKPKRGYIPALTEFYDLDKEKLCQFCCNQMFRVHCEGKFEECSLYCPVDLFSGSKWRMKKALLSLLAVPQNNIRIFKNGEQAYPPVISSEVLQNKATPQTSKLKSLQDVLSQLNSREMNTTCDDLTSAFIDLLCDALLLPVTEKTDDMSDITSHTCSGHLLKQKLSHRKNGKHCLNNETKPTVLPCTSILGLILAAQKLNAYSIRDIHSFYQTVQVCRDQKGLEGVLSLDAPYTANVWHNVVEGKMTNCIQDCGRAIHPLTHAAIAVRRFLIAKSFSDCSIMVSFRQIQSTSTSLQLKPDNIKPDASCNILTDSNGVSYIVSIAVVDMDPKPSSRIPFYIEHNDRLSSWWKSISF